MSQPSGTLNFPWGRWIWSIATTGISTKQFQEISSHCELQSRAVHLVGLKFLKSINRVIQASESSKVKCYGSGNSQCCWQSYFDLSIFYITIRAWRAISMYRCRTFVVNSIVFFLSYSRFYLQKVWTFWRGTGEVPTYYPRRNTRNLKSFKMCNVAEESIELIACDPKCCRVGSGRATFERWVRSRMRQKRYSAIFCWCDGDVQQDPLSDSATSPE